MNVPGEQHPKRPFDPEDEENARGQHNVCLNADADSNTAREGATKENKHQPTTNNKKGTVFNNTKQK